MTKYIGDVVFSRSGFVYLDLKIVKVSSSEALSWVKKYSPISNIEKINVILLKQYSTRLYRVIEGCTKQKEYAHGDVVLTLMRKKINPQVVASQWALVYLYEKKPEMEPQDYLQVRKQRRLIKTYLKCTRKKKIAYTKKQTDKQKEEQRQKEVEKKNKLYTGIAIVILSIIGNQL